MYQFIVATRSSGTCVGTGSSSWSGTGAIVGDISTMALAGNGTNKWASRAVVALQLAAWSAVGIVLLEKGITALQKSPHTPRNVTQEITTPVSSIDPQDSQLLNNPKRIERLSEIETDPLSVIPMDNDESNRPNNRLKQVRNPNSFSDKVEKLPMADPKESKNLNCVDKSSISPRQQIELTNEKLVNDATTKSASESNRLDDSADKNSEKKVIYLGRFVAPNFHKTNDRKEDNENVEKEDRDSAIATEIPQEKNWNNPVTIKVLTDNFEEHRWETRKRLRGARVNAGGGAAAAVAMVAVGAIMLILGPAVIILRALDERRQERRFLKLSGVEDLPPSYEEATSELDQAPTYSSLNLDTLLTTPSSPNSNASENICLTSNCRRESCCC